MNNFVKNNKASILPVTIIAMFIVMIIAYACIKMFLTQNIIATTDQIKIRTRYAAEGFAEKQKSAIYNLIESQFKNDPNVSITADTTLSNTGISNLGRKNGENVDTFSINFNDILISPNTNINSAPFVSADTMFPDIKLSTSSISPMAFTSWLNDCGIEFYKKKGVTKSYNQLYVAGAYAYTGLYSLIDNNVYDDSQKLQTITNTGIPSTYVFFSCNYEPDPWNMKPNFENAILKINGGNWNTFSNETNWTQAKNNFENKYPGGPADFGGKTEALLVGWLIDFVVANFRQGYVLTTTVKSPRIPASGDVVRIPEMTSTVKIYFDVFMTKLYRAYRPWTNHTSGGPATGRAVTTVRVYWGNNKWNWEGKWNYIGNYQNERCVYEFVEDSTKYVNNIKFHIQKWEVVS